MDQEEINMFSTKTRCPRKNNNTSQQYNTKTLKMMDMFSSVSGGTWFLSKLVFDENFSASVLDQQGGDFTEYMAICIQ